MPVRYLSEPELVRLSSWPGEIADEDAVTYFTLSADDLSWLAGFNRAPQSARRCRQGRTRREHRARVLTRLGWRLCAAGPTLATFAIFNLAGLQFSPRIRDIGRLQLYRLGTASSWRAQYPPAGPLLGQPIQTQLIAEHWDDLLRLVASMKFGHTTASLLIAKLHASSRQSALAKALHEYGRLIRTIYVCRHVTDVELRRRVRRQLNKGESPHALRRDLFFAHQGRRSTAPSR
jgi:Tn3 transposase DDE domain